ncbi:MAG: phenylalanine--tRNA ligase subunit beta [Staphylothermus sp.]|nr:phenylalanine--tRNA ligase subunit beta [Staphylothermus sp.]
MPVIKIMKWDLERLLGKVLSVDEILDYLPRIKCEVDNIGEEGEIEYEATHDRPDLYSVEGVARNLRSLLGLGENKYQLIDEGLKAYNLGVPGRPYIALAVVRDLDLDDEAVKQIMQLQEKLHTTYCRRRRKASIGVYDLDKVKPPLYYELADPNTKFIPLDESREMTLKEILTNTEKGREYGYIIANWEKYPILRDSKGTILSMPPVINSEDTRVTIETRNVVIDATGIDPKTVIDMVTIMAYNIAERSRGKKIVFVETIMPDNSILKAPREKGVTIELIPNNVNEVLGTNLDTKQIVVFLKKFDYQVPSNHEGHLVVVAPPYRVDIKSWIDVVEDIAMAYGYDMIGSTAYDLPKATHPGRVHPLEFISITLRKILVGMGFIEVVNYMMSNPQVQLEIFGIEDELITVANPKMEKFTSLRRWLVPGLLEVINANKEKEVEIKIFEIGDVAIPDKSTETGARIERRLGIAVSHRKATLTDGLAIVTTLMERLGLSPRYEKGIISGLLPQRTAKIYVDNTEVGYVGEIHPKILLRIGYDKPVVVSEIVLNKLLMVLRE